jgi:hypothetical protein
MLGDVAVQPGACNAFDTGDEGIEDRLMHFGPEGVAIFVVVAEPLQ